MIILRHYIGIDGGGTKTKLIVVDNKLNIIFAEEFSGSNLISTNSDITLKIIEDKIKQIAAKYNVSGIGMGIAGIDTEEDREKINQIMKNKFPGYKVKVVNDGVASLLGALNKKPGILINAGTGSIAIGLDDKGIIYRAGGWDYLLGDEGSGYWIGKKFIQAAVNDFDQGRKESEVVRIVEEFFGVSSLEKIINLIYSEGFQKELIAELAIDVARLAGKGNKVALDIYRQVGIELARLVAKVFTKGDFIQPVRLTYSGSIFKSYDLFKESFVTILEKKGIGFKWQEPVFPPEVGAVLLVIDNNYIEGSI